MTRPPAPPYEWLVDIGNADSKSYTIGIIVDGRYTRDSSFDNTVVTVSKPLQNFITGGGHIINESSAGVYAGDFGLKTNFGFNIKFNKQLTNIQGKVNIIIRQDEKVYQIKTNSTESLVVDPLTLEATFVSKANLKDITDPLNVISLGGNLSLISTVTDNGEPGDSDTVGFTLWKNGQLWYSSHWNGAVTIEQLLAGGNLKVHAQPNTLLLVAQPVDSGSVAPLATDALASVIEDAEAIWADASAQLHDQRGLKDVAYRIADLPDRTLGMALGNTVWIDVDGAGHGWRVPSIGAHDRAGTER